MAGMNPKRWKKFVYGEGGYGPARHLGWKGKEPRDKMDFLFRNLNKAAMKAAIPASTDLRGKCSPVENQLNLGSCVGNAIVGDVECLMMHHLGKYVDISRLFPYYGARKIEGSIPYDEGCYIRDGMKSAEKEGLPLESLYPYIVSQFAKKPSAAAYKDALTRQILQYERVTTLAEMKAALAIRHPFVIGIVVYSSFFQSRTELKGTVYMPDPMREAEEGGHAICIVGYNDRTQRFIFRNSWGGDWGNLGYGTIPYKYLADPALAADGWVIKLGEQM
jgi:C1A family cysteine protease